MRSLVRAFSAGGDPGRSSGTVAELAEVDALMRSCGLGVVSVTDVRGPAWAWECSERNERGEPLFQAVLAPWSKDPLPERGVTVTARFPDGDRSVDVLVPGGPVCVPGIVAVLTGTFSGGAEVWTDVRRRLADAGGRVPPAFAAVACPADVLADVVAESARFGGMELDVTAAAALARNDLPSAEVMSLLAAECRARRCDPEWMPSLVRHAALPYGEAFAVASVSGKAKAFAALAARGDVPPDVLARLSGDPRATVREAVAGNPSCPAGVLDVLAGDAHDKVRAAVASNPSASEAAVSFVALVADG